MRKKALVVGATGLIGRKLLQILQESSEYEKIIVLSRRALNVNDEKVDVHVIDFEKIVEYEQLFSVDNVFCTLGTTMKKAKTKEQFVKVDFEYPLQVAKIAKQRGVEQFFLVTAMGANQHSKFFYNQVKGNIEAAIKELQFTTFYIIRPSLLLGKRKEVRLGEDVAQFITNKLPFLFKGKWKRYQPNHGEDVAQAMYRLSLQSEQGTFIVESENINQLK